MPWLAGLLLAYLLVPVAAYLGRVGGAPAGALGSAGAAGMADALAVSLQTASIATAVVAVLGVPLGYLLSRGRGRTSALLGLVVQLPLALPPLMSGILLLYVVGPYTPVGAIFGGRLTDDRAGIVLAQVFVAAPFCVIAARSAFAALDPALDDVAATLGHGRWSRFVRSALPGAAPGIGAGLVLTWLRAFGEFGATVVLAYHPYSLPVYTYVQFGSTGLVATLAPVGAALLAALAVLVLVHLAPRLRRPRHRPGAVPPALPPAGGGSPLLTVRDLRARLGTFELVISESPASRHLAILGPSGAGKTLILRLLAGLVTPSHGRVLIDGVDVTGLAPEHRAVGYVPQDSALLPHLPVWDQVTFGVGADPELAAYWIGRLRLAGLEDRLPSQLSGGQRRRVALARALARAPRLLLLDEPFTGLDTPVRGELRDELRRLQRDTPITTVLVTHDAVDAAQLADEILILVDGRTLQAGPQPEVFHRPVDVEVARLLGVRNLLPGRVIGPGLLGVGELVVPVATDEIPAGTEITWAIPPDKVRLSTTGRYEAVVISHVTYPGHHELLLGLPGGAELTARTSGPDGLAVGTRCRIELPAAAVTVWPGGQAGAAVRTAPGRGRR